MSIVHTHDVTKLHLANVFDIPYYHLQFYTLHYPFSIYRNVIMPTMTIDLSTNSTCDIYKRLKNKKSPKPASEPKCLNKSMYALGAPKTSIEHKYFLS